MEKKSFDSLERQAPVPLTKVADESWKIKTKQVNSNQQK